MKGIMRQIAPFGSRQKGGTAIEFAFVFPILLAVAYAGVVYTYVYVLQQALTFAAQQGAQAAVAVVPTSDAAGTKSSRLTQANVVALASLNWLPTSQFSRISKSTPNGCSSTVPVGSTTFVYQLDFSLSGATGGGGALFPSLINLPLVGTIPPLPASLVGCAVAFT